MFLAVRDSSQHSEEIMEILNCTFYCDYYYYYYYYPAIWPLRWAVPGLETSMHGCGQLLLACHHHLILHMDGSLVGVSCFYGLVVKASILIAGDHGSNHRTRCPCGYPARHLVSQVRCSDWFVWCQYIMSGWGSKFDQQLTTRIHPCNIRCIVLGY